MIRIIKFNRLACLVVVALLLCLPVLALRAATPASAAGDPPDVVANRFSAAQNVVWNGTAADVDGVMALLTNDWQSISQYTFNGRVVRLGAINKVDFAAVLKSQAGTGGQQRLVSTEVNGNFVTARLEHAAGVPRQVGVSRALSTNRHEVIDGKIKSTVLDWDITDAETVRFLTILKAYPPPPAPPATGTGLRAGENAGGMAGPPAGAVLVLAGAVFFLLPTVMRRRATR